VKIAELVVLLFSLFFNRTLLYDDEVGYRFT